MGRWLGVSKRIGSQMAYYVLAQNGQIIVERYETENAVRRICYVQKGITVPHEVRNKT